MREIVNCTLCPLHTTRTHICWGEALSPCSALFVGEAPGATEDAVGRPFIGRSGAALRAIVGKAGLTHVGYTNMVRCRPPSNRKPTAQEQETCRVWLDKELVDFSPRVVVLLGNIALPLAFPGYRIGQVNGSVRSTSGRLWVACYHPAAALRDPRLWENIYEAVSTAGELTL